MKYTRIKGDVPQNVVRLPRAGKIRLGVKVKSAKGTEYPKETDHFVCPPEVKAVFGEEPKTLRVMIPTENEEMFCKQYYAIYGSNQKLKCQGDGETFERRVESGIEKGECPSPKECEYAIKLGKNGRPACSARMDLMVVLPDVSVGAVYQVSTGSINSDIDIRSGLEMARSLYGRISWVPMELKREPMKIADPESGKMNTHWPVKLHPVGNLETVMAVRRDPMLIPPTDTVKYLVADPKIEGEEADTPIEFTEVEPENAEQEPSPSQFQFAEIIERLRTEEGIEKEEILVYITGSASLDELTKIWHLSIKHLANMTGPERAELQSHYDMQVKEFKRTNR